MKEQMTTDWETHDLIISWKFKMKFECVWRNLYLFQELKFELIIVILLNELESLSLRIGNEVLLLIELVTN
jgi:hypothetical protein